MKLYEELGNIRGIASSNTNIGELYMDQEKYEQAFGHLIKAYNILEEIKDTKGMSNSLNGIGNLLIKQGKNNEAIIYLKRSIEKAIEIGVKKELGNAYKYISRAYAHMNEYKAAYDYRLLFQEINDSLFNEEKTKQLAEMDVKYETEKKEKEIDLLIKDKEINELTIITKETEIAKQKIFLILFSVSLIFLMILAFVIYHMYKLKKNANEEFEFHFNEINQQKEEIEQTMKKKWLSYYTETSRKNAFFAGQLGILLYCCALSVGLFPFVELNIPLVVSIFFPAPIIIIIMFLQKRLGLRHEFLLFAIMCTFTLSTALLPLFVDNEFWQSMLALANVATFIIASILILTKAKNVLLYIIYAVVVNIIIVYFFEDFSYEILIGSHVVAMSVAISTILLTRYKYDTAKKDYILTQKLNYQKIILEKQSHKLKLTNKKLNKVNEEIQVQAKNLIQLNDEITTKNNRLFQQKKEIEDKNQQFEKTNATKDKFFSIIAHDLKGSFSAFLNVSGLLSQQAQDISKDAQNKLLQTIDKSANHLFQLLDNLLNWARSQKDVMQHNPQKFNLNEIINENKALFEISLKRKKIEFISDLSENLNVFVDLEMINIVIRNLISNAIKYSYPDSQIKITAKEINNFIELDVTDFGIGLEKEKIDKLFRLDKHLTTLGTNNEQGSGLGLILSKEFIEKNNGSIKVKSEPGKKTSFTLTLTKYIE